MLLLYICYYLTFSQLVSSGLLVRYNPTSLTTTSLQIHPSNEPDLITTDITLMPIFEITGAQFSHSSAHTGLDSK